MRPTLRALTILSCLATALSWQVPSLTSAVKPDFCESFSACGGGDSGVTCTCTRGCKGGDGRIGDDKEPPITTCMGDTDCPSDKQCLMGTCVDPCYGRCGANTECSAVDHVAQCRCKPGHVGNPVYSCDPIAPDSCLDNSFCPDDKYCVGSVCVNPCNVITCPDGFVCKVGNHAASCIYNKIEKPDCTYDSNCPNERVCIAGKCVDPCANKGDKSICHMKGSLCQVINHQTFCIIDPEPNECLEQDDCPTNRICQRKKCIDPCENKDYCKGGKCGVVFHKVSCLIEDPKDTCTDDKDCPKDKECDDGKCVDPCLTPGICKRGECMVFKHRPICRITFENCDGDADCPANKQCINQRCEDPCKNNICSANEECLVIDHKASCTKIEKPECVKEDDCGDTKTCAGDKCIDPCKDKNCRENEICVVSSHRANCQYRPKVQCEEHSQCNSDQQCKMYKCVDPCNTGSECKKDETCLVQDHVVSCIIELPFDCESNDDCNNLEACYDGECRDPCEKMKCGKNEECSVIDHEATCIVTDEPSGCRSHADCSSNQVCYKKEKCIDPCTYFSKPRCKKNQKCSVDQHKIYCKATITPKLECSDNDDCEASKACTGNECVDPCTNNACGEGSSCSVENHIAICTIVTPDSKNCSSEIPCPGGSVCKDGTCVHLCKEKQCAFPATCRVVGGEATCTCSLGYKETDSGCVEDPGGKGGDDGGIIGGRGIGNCSANLFWKRPASPKTYKIIHKKVPWTMAYAYCISHGMRLATIESEEENQLILDEIKKTNIRHKGFWVDGVGTPGYPWKWFTTGLPFRTFSYWHAGYPLAVDYYHCMEYLELGTVGYKWFHRYCWNPMLFQASFVRITSEAFLNGLFKYQY